MFLLVPAHPGCPRQSLETHKMVVVVVVITNLLLNLIPNNLLSLDKKVDCYIALYGSLRRKKRVKNTKAWSKIR